MERPQHSLRGLSTKSNESKIIGIGIVVALHVAIIVALILGLSNGAIRKEMQEIQASVVKKEVIRTPPPPPPVLMKPPPAIVAPPAIVIQTASPPPAAPPAAKAPPVAAPPAPPPPTKLEAVARTHTLPPYPALSQRMGEQGTTVMRVNIGTDGRVTNAVVVTSSGSQRLDDAAVQFVKDNWRWQPPTQLGKPVEATTLVSMKWDLKNAQ